jgi:hypothetical protein
MAQKGRGIFMVYVDIDAKDAPDFNAWYNKLESLGFTQDFLSGCELEALHVIGIRPFGEEFGEDVVFRGIQEEFRKPLA